MSRTLFVPVLLLLSLTAATAIADGVVAPKLIPPSAKGETYTDTQDFPFATPIKGATLVATSHDPTPLDIAGPDDKAPVLVGTGTLTKQYDGPPGLLDDDLAAAYDKAFRAAGWTMKPLATGGALAHWSKNGRELWVRVWREGGNSWDMSLTDVGGGLATALHSDCKAQLYGLHFDFNKATLQPDSEPVLNQVLAILKADKTSAFKLAGHTDDVGGAAYNKKLSAARADTVKAWLVAHGAAAARITASGFGDTAPLVPNDSDSNRARNRRVELSKSGCK
ncbi:MAG: OmpA family protein [Kofleriaceae bacterium]